MINIDNLHVCNEICLYYMYKTLCDLQGDVTAFTRPDRTAGRCSEDVRVAAQHRRMGGQGHLAELLRIHSRSVYLTIAYLNAVTFR